MQDEDKLPDDPTLLELIDQQTEARLKARLRDIEQNDPLPPTKAPTISWLVIGIIAASVGLFAILFFVAF